MNMQTGVFSAETIYNVSTLQAFKTFYGQTIAGGMKKN
jgi:hypothetical protein